MATITQTKLVGFGYGNKSNYSATTYANHIWFDPTNKQILLNGIEYIPKKLSELVNDKNFITSITKSMVEGVLTGNITSHTHSYLSLSGGTMYNTDLVTNLNADLLDGYHAEVFVKSDIDRTDDLTKLTKRAYFKTAYIPGQGDFCSLVVPTWMGNKAEYYYITELRFKNDSINPQIRTYSKDNGTSSWGSLALLTDNVASASKWANARTITLTGSVTGSVSIDGSANVSLATTTNHTHSEYLPLTGGTLSGALTCNGYHIDMNNDSGSRGYRGFFNQSNNTSRASGSHIFMKGGGQALGTNSVSIGYQAYAGIRNEDADKTTYPYIAWQWMPTEKINITINNQDTANGEFYGYEVLGGKMVQYELGGNTYTYENTSTTVRVLVCVKDDADTGLIFGGKSYMPYNATKTLIQGKYILAKGESITEVNTITVGEVNYYVLAIYTWSATVGYDYSTQVKVMCATKVNNSDYNGASSYASGFSSVASGRYSVASGNSSVASGFSSVASGRYSVASGESSVASGFSSVASGVYSVASGVYSVASGYSSVASHDFSAVLARNGETMSSYQTIVGKFNAKVAGLFIIGNGTSDTARSNALVVDESGNVTAKYFSGYANAVGSEGIKVYANNSNEINFGGTSSSTTIFFGYRSMDSRPTPTAYNFGNGTATLKAASFSGNAATATALTSSAGSATQPIYFSNGKPVACSYTLAKSVPSNAVFTDTTYSVATASANGLMSSAMFKAQMVKSVSVRQGSADVIVGGSITNHSVYITQKKSNITNAYQQAIGENDVKIPNATKDYDGSMSYTDKRKIEAIFNDSGIYNSVWEISESKMEIESGIDIGAQTELLDYWQLPMATTSLCGLMTGTDKRKLDKMPTTVFGAQLIFYNNEILVDGTYGDYNIEIGDATVDGYETIQENNHYITMVAFSITNNDLIDKLRNGYVKFGYSSKDNATNETMRLLQSNFDGSDLFVEFIHSTPIGSKSFYFDCIWDVYPII